jgi:hypothetical protein
VSGISFCNDSVRRVNPWPKGMPPGGSNEHHFIDVDKRLTMAREDLINCVVKHDGFGFGRIRRFPERGCQLQVFPAILDSKEL